VDTVHILLAGGADVRARDASGSTPLEILARWAGPNDRDERDATAAGAYRALERLLRDADGA